MSIHCLNLAFGVHLPKRPAEKLVLLALADRASDEDGSAYPSIWNLVYKTSLDERTVRRALVSLEARGFLRREPRPNKSSVYWLNASALLAASVAWPDFSRRPTRKGKGKRSKGARS